MSRLRELFRFKRMMPAIKGLSTVGAAGATAAATAGLFATAVPVVAVVGAAGVGSAVINSIVDYFSTSSTQREMDELRDEIRQLKESIDNMRASIQFVRDITLFVIAYFVLDEVIKLLNFELYTIFWGFIFAALYSLMLGFWAERSVASQRRVDDFTSDQNQR